MLQMGYIEIAYDEDNHLKVTPLGEDVLYGRKQAQLSVIVREELRVTKRNREKAALPSADSLQTEDQLLFEKLRSLRKTIADELKTPAYIVLSDKSLQSIVAQKPTRLLDFGNIYGVGDHKKEQFGNRFVDLVCSHLGIPRPHEKEENKDKNLRIIVDEGQSQEEELCEKKISYMDQQKQKFANAYSPWTTEEESALIALYKLGKSVKEIGTILQRNEGSIRSRLKKLGIG